MTSVDAEVETLRREAQSVAAMAWDNFRVDFHAEPVARRLEAAVDAAADVYEGRLHEKGRLGYDMRVRGGPPVFDGTVHHIDRLEPYVILQAKQHGSAVLSVYEPNFQALTLTFVGLVEESSPPT